jgi:hypothetical protein
VLAVVHDLGSCDPLASRKAERRAQQGQLGELDVEPRIGRGHHVLERWGFEAALEVGDDLACRLHVAREVRLRETGRHAGRGRDACALALSARVNGLA